VKHVQEFCQQKEAFLKENPFLQWVEVDKSETTFPARTTVSLPFRASQQLSSKTCNGKPQQGNNRAGRCAAHF